MNETCNIVVKTPVGKTDEFQVKSIVQQGSVTGGMLCTASTAEITKQELGRGTQIGKSNIKALTFVDDIIGSNTTVPCTYKSHEMVVWFSLLKRLGLNIPKCMIMGINMKSSDDIPRLKIDGKPLSEVNKAVYLGDVYNSRGNNWDLVESRVNKGQCCLVKSMSLCADTTLGVHSIQTLLLLYRSLFEQVVLNNSQSWTNIIEKQMEALQTIQLRYIKRIFYSPSSTPNALSYLETGILPIEDMVNIKRLTFLHHILSQDENDPVKISYCEQMKFEFERNWGNEVKEIRDKYQLSYSDREIASMNKPKWSNIVKAKVKSFSLKSLKKEAAKLKHVNVDIDTYTQS